MDKKKLTDKQEMFCKEYMVDLNATQAAIRAGYSKNTAAEQGCQNLIKLNIQERIQELKQKRSAKVEITAERVLEEVGYLAFSDIPNYFKQIGDNGIYTLTMEQFESMPEGASRAISSVEQSVDKDGNIVYKIKLWDKPRNLELLCKHLGIAKEIVKHEFDAVAGVAIAKEIVKVLQKKGDE